MVLLNYSVQIEYKNATNVWQEIGSVGSNVTRYSNGTYLKLCGALFRVRAFNGSGNSAYSNVADAGTVAGA